MATTGFLLIFLNDLRILLVALNLVFFVFVALNVPKAT